MEDKKIEPENKSNSDNTDGKKIRPKSFKPIIAGWMLMMVFFFVLIGFIRVGLFSSNPEGSGTVFGIVTDSENETFIPNTIIEIIGENLSTKTDKNGEFEIKNVPAGKREIKIYKEGYRATIVKIFIYDEDKYNVSVSLEYDIGIVPAKELELGNIKGKITDNNSSEPINNVNISIIDTNLSTKTDKNGNYSLKNVHVGIIEIKASKKGNITISKKILVFPKQTIFENFTLVEGEDIKKEGYDITNKKGKIHGIVKDQNETPIKNASISISGNNLSIKTDKNGKFTIEVTYGKHELKASKENYQSVYKYVVLANESYLNFTLEIGKEPIIKDEIDELTTLICSLIVAILALFTFIGGFCAIKRKLYALSIISSMCGILIGFVMIVIFLLSIFALVLIALSKDEFIS